MRDLPFFSHIPSLGHAIGPPELGDRPRSPASSWSLGRAHCGFTPRKGYRGDERGVGMPSRRSFSASVDWPHATELWHMTQAKKKIRSKKSLTKLVRSSKGGKSPSHSRALKTLRAKGASKNH